MGGEFEFRFNTQILVKLLDLGYVKTHSNKKKYIQMIL
jgi:hypothetical protein